MSGAAKGGSGKGSGGRSTGGRGGVARGGDRGLKIKVKTAKRRSAQSTRWLERQLNDPYVAAARREGWRSRAAFKLIELDDKYHFLKPGQAVVDLGAAPGGWSQVAAKRVEADKGRGKVVAIDILAIDPIPHVDFVELDFMDDAAPDRLKAMLGGPADVVLSDMAANTIGHRQTDHIRTTALLEAAVDFAVDVLKPGGTFLGKAFQGGTEGRVLDVLKRRFATVRHVKPPASRQESVEIYVIATGFRPAAADEARSVTADDA